MDLTHRSTATFLFGVVVFFALLFLWAESSRFYSYDAGMRIAHMESRIELLEKNLQGMARRVAALKDHAGLDEAQFND